ncbi:MAG TPA: DUF1501 domain-containing protein [Bryobacteraceae bacterium]|nr:DUF1501 domain-containing protein [Bryobacteraceae bacterium]
MLRPVNVYATESVKLRGAAEFCIFIFLNGGASQIDTFDLKEGAWTPPDFAVRSVKPGIRLPSALFPELLGHMDELAIVRSLQAWESAHARAQYYLQVGHSFSPARRKEMPAIGAVIAYEMQARRKESDFLPPFVAMNFNNSQAGLVREGCLNSKYGPLPLDMQQGNEFVLQTGEKAAFDRRWQLLARLEHADPFQGQTARSEFQAYAKGAFDMMESPRIAEALTLSPEDHKRYGGSPLGDACILARNMVRADGGTRFMLLSQNGWDLHANMYDPKNKGNHYGLCRDLDHSLSALLTDLKASRAADGKTLLEKTFVVVMGEFGRTGGGLTVNHGRDHNRFAASALFAGAGVRGGQAIGATDPKAEQVIQTGWGEKRPIYTEDVIATIYSQMGIDWNKRITHTPSGRDFEYLEPMSGTEFVAFREISPLFS